MQHMGLIYILGHRSLVDWRVKYNEDLPISVIQGGEVPPFGLFAAEQRRAYLRRERVWGGNTFHGFSSDVAMQCRYQGQYRLSCSLSS